MIDRERRSLASTLIRKLLIGQLTVDDFDDQFPKKSVDRALGAIYEQLWFYWDDRRSYSVAAQEMPQEVKDLFRRCIAFLDSDLEYEWPQIPRAPFVTILLRLTGFDRLAERRADSEFRQIASTGDFRVWPFAHEQDIPGEPNHQST
jgi:hypothetical protein